MRPLIEPLLLPAHNPTARQTWTWLAASNWNGVAGYDVFERHIHFPVDWVLLRDAMRTLMRAAQLIRPHGLKHRMAPPEDFLRAMNRLSIQMTFARRQADTQKPRKGCCA